MNINPNDISTIETIVRTIAGEVQRARGSAPIFAGGKTFEKRVSIPVSPAGPVPVSVQAPAPAPVSVQAPAPAQTAPAPAPGKKLRPEDLLLDKQVVTLRDVEHLPRAVKKLIVPQTALLTPSARDELSEQNIRLARYSAEAIAELSEAPASNAQAQANRVRMGSIEVYAVFTPYNPESLFPLWTRCGWHPNMRSGFICFDRTRESMAKNQTLNVLFTSKVDEALVKLNREPKISAISSTSPERLVKQWKDFSSVNTLVVNPSEIGIYLAGQIVMRAAELYYL